MTSIDQLSHYDFDLPEDRIAQTPLPDRAASRLLVLDKSTGGIRHLRFRDAGSLLRPGDLLVVNRTRVTALRLLGNRINPQSNESGGLIELLLIKKLGPKGVYEALTKPAKRLQVGTQVRFGNSLTATVVELGVEGKRIVKLDPEEEIENQAFAPLPPYIRTTLQDRERYQTIYSKQNPNDGSAAAPTAGLHFTQEILDEITKLGVEIAEVELSIGLDTFRPVQVENLDDHRMQGEWCHLPQETAEKIKETKGQVVAVGTTTTRTLETFARKSSSPRDLVPGSLESKLFLRPGNPMLLVDALFTNFHMPRTSMLLMLSALAGRDNVFAAYQEALKEQYRFLSFGDSMYIGDINRQ